MVIINMRGRSLQVFTALIASLSIIGVGEAIGWTSPALEYLSSEESEVPLKTNQRAWLASINSLSTIIGYLMISLFMDRLGRKYSLIIYAIPQCISWIIIIMGKSFTTLCFARVIAGWGYAGAIGLTTVYLAEITDKNIRGMVTVFLVLSSDVGILIAGLTGAYLSYHHMNLVLLIPSVLYLLTLPFIPESPYFYFMKNREEQGIKTLEALRSDPDSVQMEANEMKNLTKRDESLQKRFNFLELFASKGNRRALLVVFFAQLTFVFSGSVVILTYAQEIFRLSGFFLTPAISAVLLAGVKIISGLMSTQLIEKAGRRVFFLISGILATGSLIFVGVFFLLKNKNLDISGVTWMPLAGLLGYEIALPLGVSTIPHIFTGELFSLKVKQSGIIFVHLITPLLMFATKFVFPVLNDFAGIHTTFFIFAVFCLLGTFVIFLYAPETKGKSLEEIQSILNKL